MTASKRLSHCPSHFRSLYKTITRFGGGNTALFPVVGISGSEAEPYVITSHTSEVTPKNLTNAQTATFIPRTVINPLDNVNFFVSQHYRDFLSREPDASGLAFWS